MRTLLKHLRHAIIDRRAEKELSRIEAVIPAEWRPSTRKALAGDDGEAKSLIYASGERERGLIALAAFRAGTPNPAFRTMLGYAWTSSDTTLADACGKNKKLIRKMFKRAAFPLPELPERVTVFRGVLSYSSNPEHNGLAWTVNRKAACWFATRIPIFPNPAVLRAVVKRSDIVFYSNDRGEEEVVLRIEPPHHIDGEPREWRQAGAEWVEAR